MIVWNNDGNFDVAIDADCDSTTSDFNEDNDDDVSAILMLMTIQNTCNFTYCNYDELSNARTNFRQYFYNDKLELQHSQKSEMQTVFATTEKQQIHRKICN